jgi:hypothetical protein
MPASMLPGSIATRQAASQGFIDEGGFGGIPLQIGQFGFRGSNFAVERRVDRIRPVRAPSNENPL